MSDKRWLWLIAGPNGAGKSTLARGFEHLLIVNPDVEAQRQSPHRPDDAFGVVRERRMGSETSRSRRR